MSSILLEAINENGLSYREIYNSVGNATNNFTKESGNFKYETQFEANIAKGILKEKYSNVYIKPLNMSKEYDLFYSVVYSKPKESKLEGEVEGKVEGEPEDEVEESLTESYRLNEGINSDSDFVKQALVDHPELRPLIRENKWEELWNTIGGRGPAYDEVQGDLYPRDRNQSASFWGPSAISKFIRVFAEAGIDYKIKEIPEYCFINSDITSFKIPDGTKEIGLSAFYNCTKLESIEIPDSVESISVSAFFNCINLRDVKLPSHLSIIGAKAFCGCNSFSEVIIPESCTSIMDAAFSHCKSLQRVVIPKTCTHIGTNAFYGCRKIQSITLPDRKYKYMEYMKKIGIDSIPKQNIKISESLPVEEEKEYKDFEFQPSKNPAGTPLGNGTGFGEGLIEKIVKKDDGYYVQSEKGKNLGGPYSKEDAEKRLKQVEYFKNKSLKESDANNAFDAELVKDEIRNQLIAALKKKYKNPVIDFDDEYDDGSKFRINVEVYDKWNFLAGRYFTINYNDPYFDLVGDVSNFVNKIVYQIKHPYDVYENLNEAYEYLLDPKFEEFVIAKGLDVDDVIENYSDEELDALGAEFYASKNSSPKPSFYDYMETEFDDDDRWEENPDVEEYYRNKYNIELGEDIEEVDPEDKEVFCPYCYDQLEFVGYQGNIEEYKCSDCDEYYYIDPQNPEKLYKADEAEVLFTEDLITDNKKPLNETEAKVGAKYKNKRGAILRVEEPDKVGNIQYSFIKDGRIVDTKSSPEASFNKMLKTNGYEPFNESTEESLNEGFNLDTLRKVIEVAEFALATGLAQRIIPPVVDKIKGFIKGQKERKENRKMANTIAQVLTDQEDIDNLYYLADTMGEAFKYGCEDIAKYIIKDAPRYLRKPDNLQVKADRKFNSMKNEEAFIEDLAKKIEDKEARGERHSLDDSLYDHSITILWGLWVAAEVYHLLYEAFKNGRARAGEESLTESVPSGGHYLINGKVYKLDFDKMYDYANEKGLLFKNGLERVLSKFTDGFSVDDQAIGDFENYLKFNRGVDVDESLTEDKNETLNKDIWDDNNELRPEVKEKLELIVNKFKDALKEDNVDLDIQDVEIVGSNANYNYTDKSDIDLHIIADLSIYKDKEDLAEIIYNAYRRIFNDKFDPMIRGHEVELYVEPAEDTNSNDILDGVEDADD